MNSVGVLIPILVPLGAFAMIFGISYLRTRENIALIEKGMNPKQFASQPAPYRSLKWGLLLLGSGIGLALAFFFDKNMGGSNNEAVYFSMVAIGGGLGLISSYTIEKKQLPNRTYTAADAQTETVYREQ